MPTISGNEVPQDYGDRVTGAVVPVSGGQFTYGNLGEGYTPNVQVEYRSGFSTPLQPGVSVWHDNYGDRVNVLFSNQSSDTLSVRFVADDGYHVDLYQFDLAGWPNSDYVINAVRILNGDALLFSQSNVLVEGDLNGPRHTLFTFPTALSGTDLLLEVDYRNLPGGIRDNIGIDNIRFGQTPPAVPLPAAAWLFGSGVIGLVGVARRRTGLRG